MLAIYARSDQETFIFQIGNSSGNREYFLGANQNEAMKWAVVRRHIKNQKLARVRKVGIAELERIDPKFASSVARALNSKIQGLVKNHNGFAVVDSNGAVFTPLSAVTN